MSIVKRLEKFLDQRGVSYGRFTHHRANTAATAAIAEHVVPEDHAKVVIVKADERSVMIVLPADRRIDLSKCAEALGAKKVRIAFEEEVYDLFDDCETGAMPPFGNLYGLPVWVDIALTKDPEIAFAGGTHRDSVQMRYTDFERLVNPDVADLTVEATV